MSNVPFLVDETSRRHSDSLSGVPVRLADGNLWTMAVPAVVLKYGPEGRGPVWLEFYMFPGGNDLNLRFRQAWLDFSESHPQGVLDARQFAGTALLRNYELDGPELLSLLTLDVVTSEEFYVSWQALWDESARRVEKMVKALPYGHESVYNPQSLLRN